MDCARSRIWFPPFSALNYSSPISRVDTTIDTQWLPTYHPGSAPGKLLDEGDSTMNRPVMKLAVLGLAILAAALLTVAGPGRKSEKRAINLPGAPAGLPFSSGILAGNMLYLS